ncbi:hypothetical protein PO124_25085 [Bacillus licheniformis]|nr:hypothetical protein [Bacillus licheniformis]
MHAAKLNGITLSRKKRRSCSAPIRRTVSCSSTAEVLKRRKSIL